MYFDIIFVLQNVPKVNAYYFKSHPNSIRQKAPPSTSIRQKAPLCKGGCQESLILDWGIVRLPSAESKYVIPSEQRGAEG